MKDRLHPPLAIAVRTHQGGRIFRKGAWGGKNGTLCGYPTITKAAQAAGGHPAIVAELEL